MALNFKKESEKFALALHREHDALGELLEAFPDSPSPELPVGPSRESIDKARKAYEEVRHQRARVEAARGHRG